MSAGANSFFQKLKRAKGTEPGLVSPEAWNYLLDYIEDLEKRVRQHKPRSSPSIQFKTGPDGFTAHTKKSSRGAASASICPFGELIPIDDETAFTKGIRGGVVYCGDKNFDVPYQGINLAVPGTWLVQLEIECESNRDDDGEIILPGIKTSAITDASTFWDNKPWTEGTSYDDNTNPVVEDGLGTIIIPIGKLTVADGAAKFEPVACGNITIAQCAGILSHTRS